LKLQNLLINIGGFIKSINFLGSLLYYFYYKPFKNIDNVLNSHRSSMLNYLNNNDGENLNNKTENSKIKLKYNISPKNIVRDKNAKINSKNDSVCYILENKMESFMNFKEGLNGEKQNSIKNFHLNYDSKNLNNSQNI